MRKEQEVQDEVILIFEANRFHRKILNRMENSFYKYMCDWGVDRNKCPMSLYVFYGFKAFTFIKNKLYFLFASWLGCDFNDFFWLWRLLQVVRFVFDVGEKDVPQHRDTVNIKDPAMSTLTVTSNPHHPKSHLNWEGTRRKLTAWLGGQITQSNR